MSINLVPEHTLPKSFFYEEELSSRPCAAIVERVALHEPDEPARAPRTELECLPAKFEAEALSDKRRLEIEPLPPAAAAICWHSKLVKRG